MKIWRVETEKVGRLGVPPQFKNLSQASERGLLFKSPSSMLVRNLKGCPKITLSDRICRLSRRLGCVCGVPDIIIIFSKTKKRESNVYSFKTENNIGMPKT